ncbi:MAG: ABC transporter ATP-binding protein [Oceanospirillaceae bacterium]|nr:ABC transporter ATP-binding protein [Oceanospirillaceae bacterium]
MLTLLTRAIHTHNAGSDEQLAQGFRWLYAYVRPQLKAISGLLLLSLCGTGIVLLQPWLTKMLIDDGLVAGDYRTLVIVALCMIGAGILGTVLSGVNRFLHTRLSGRILFSLRNDLYRHLQTLSPAFFAQRRTGDLLARMDGDVAEIQRFAVDSLFSAVSAVIGLIGALALLVTLSWKLSLLVVLLIPFEIVWLRWMRKKVEFQTRAMRERATDVSSFLVETLPATKFIQASGQEAAEQKRLGHFSDQYLNQLLSLQVTEFFTQAVPSTLTSITRAAAFLIGGWWVIEGQWQLGSLIAFSTYLGMATGPVNSLLGLYVAVQRMSVSLVRVNELRQHQPEVTDPAEPRSLPEPVAGDITLNNIRFAYPGRSPVLIHTSAHFSAGHKIALSGPSGVGKSTLIDLLQRYADPQDGQIFLDGTNIRDLPLAELRRHVAVVSQDITLFRGSLLENLRYAAPQASDADVMEAAREAQLGEMIAQLPEGLATIMGERGQRLSGGQKQRMAIARALLQQPAVLVLDEATSAVDEETERQVISAIDRLFPHCTRIVISHRRSTLDGADLFFALKDGELTELKSEPEL